MATVLLISGSAAVMFSSAVRSRVVLPKPNQPSTVLMIFPMFMIVSPI
jgi:hypothetical protein